MNKGELKPIFSFNFIESNLESCGVMNYKNFFVFTENEYVTVVHFNLRAKRILRHRSFELPLPIEMLDEDICEFKVTQLFLSKEMDSISLEQV
jgi:hypothetical protein